MPANTACYAGYTHHADVFRHNTEASTIQYIHTCNKKDLLTTNFTGIVPSLDCSNTVTDGSCLSAAALYNFSSNSSSEAVYKLLPNAPINVKPEGAGGGRRWGI